MSRVLTVLLKKLTQMELTLRKVFINFFVKLCVKIEKAQDEEYIP